MNRLEKAYLPVMKYALFAGILGGIATFIGPPHHGLIKALIGVTIGFALCGHWFHPALKALLKASEEVMEDGTKDS